MTKACAFRLGTSVALATLALHAPHARAEGVAAGTVIENTASASFSTGGATQTVESNTVTIAVDEVLDVAVASQDSGPLPATTSAVLHYRVTNTGNGPESFVLTADPATAGNDFDVTIQNLALDTNANGTYDAGVDSLLANGTASPVLAPDESLELFVLAAVPAGTPDAQTSQVRLQAEAATGTGATGTVFAGVGEGGVDAVVGFSAAADDALGNLVASLASVSLTKSAVVADPFGGSEPVPGAIVTYTIVATVSGSGAVSDLQLTDPFPASIAYSAGTLTLDGAALSDAADADAGTVAGAAIAVDLGDVAAGVTHTVSFKVSIKD